MWRYYWQLLRHAPDEAEHLWHRLVFWVTVVASLLLFFGVDAGRPVLDVWVGLSRWWAVVPLALGVVLRLVSRNYQQVEVLRRQTDELRARVETDEARQKRHKTIRDGLGRLIAECKFYENKCLKRNGVGLAEQLEKLTNDAGAFFRDTVKDEALNNLYFMATEMDCVPDEYEMRFYNVIQDQFGVSLRLLRAKRRMMEACLDKFPPT